MTRLERSREKLKGRVPRKASKKNNGDPALAGIINRLKHALNEVEGSGIH